MAFGCKPSAPMRREDISRMSSQDAEGDVLACTKPHLTGNISEKFGI